MLVLAVDPGGTTGWAVFNTRAEGPTPRVEQTPGGLLGFMPVYADFASWANSVQPVTVVLEKFTIGARTTRYSRQDDALKIIGAVEWDAHSRDWDVVFQQPADAKKIFTDERLKGMGWYARGKEHGRDATRHLALYLFKNQLIDIHGKVRNV